MSDDPNSWSLIDTTRTLKVGDTFTAEWLDRFRALMAGYNEVKGALEELVSRCDGLEGVRADGSNIQTIRAHAALEAQNRQDTPA